MEHLNLTNEFEKYNPWITKFTINGESFGGTFDAMNDARLEQFFSAFPGAETILELGSLEGGHTFALAQRPMVRRVVGIEGRHTNGAKAQFVQRLLSIRNVQFVQANLESTNLRSFGTFDVVFCAGLLYHLPRPWELIEQIGQVSKNIFLSTHYVADDRATTTRHTFNGMIYQEFGLADPLSGMSPDSFWPTLDGLMNMLEASGFRKTHVFHNNREHPHGLIITLSARM